MPAGFISTKHHNEIIMQKVIRASIPSLTMQKRELLDSDYNNYQWWIIFGMDKGLLSAFKSYKGYKQKRITYKDYPLPIQARFIGQWIRKKDTKIASHWIKIPNSKRKGQGIWLPLHFHQNLPDNYKVNDSFIIKKNGKYYFHLCIEIPEPMPYKPKTAIGIDLGIKNPVTLTNLKTRKTIFLGKELKQNKGRYYYLRKKLGKLKKLNIIRKIKNKEKNKSNSIIHKMTKDIVKQALKEKAMLVVGDVKNLAKNKGKRFNRKLGTFQTFKIKNYLKYKAKEYGVPIKIVNESYTSKTCSACGIRGTRTKNWFHCNCGYEDNADRNASINIAKRGFSYKLNSGAAASARSPSLMNGQALI